MHELFQRVIRDIPEDDAPRLVYADWLEELGDPRGEFIRLQCELARLDAQDSRRHPLHHRQRQLFHKHKDCWVAALPRLPGVRWEIRQRWPEPAHAFERGMLARVTISDSQALLAHAEVLFAQECVRELRLVRMKPHDVDDVFALPWLSRLTLLDFPHNRITEIRPLVKADHLCHLRYLNLVDNWLGDYGTQQLTEASHLSGLFALGLTRNRIGDAGAAALAKSTNFGELKLLSLANNDIECGGAERLAFSPLARQVNVLKLSRNRIGPRGGRALAESPELDDIEQLDLRGNSLGSETEQRLRDRFGDRVLLRDEPEAYDPIAAAVGQIPDYLAK